jgi:hypothetical protein
MSVLSSLASQRSRLFSSFFRVCLRYCGYPGFSLKGKERWKVKKGPGDEGMEGKPRRSLSEASSALPDPRRKQWRAHELVPSLLMSIAAMLCGARSLYAIAQWGRERREDQPDLLVSLGLLPGKSPSVATLHRVFSRLDVKRFERILRDWLLETGLE